VAEIAMCRWWLSSGFGLAVDLTIEFTVADSNNESRVVILTNLE